MGRPSLAIVGSGPAAFYTALRVVQKVPNAKISMFEKNAFPFGLTRYGVAPDHPEVRNCQERFAELAFGHKDFSFFGNCEVGKDIELPALSRTYDAVLLAYGADGMRRLNIPGEQESKGVLGARAFVGWYNGEPGYSQLNIAPLLLRAKTATVIGNGNVALDVARVLLRDPQLFHNTDMPSYAIEALKSSKINRVQIVGRRGLLDSAFTNKELRELTKEPNTTMLPVDPISELDANPTARADKRKLDLIRSVATSISSNTQNAEWQLKFLRSPKQFNNDSNGNLVSVVWEINRCVDGKVVPTGQTETNDTELVLTSIGYKSRALPGLDTLGCEFDPQTHTIVRQRGRVVGTENLFAAGWIATGPVGVIASTMMDSFAVGDVISTFFNQLSSFKPEVALPPFNKNTVSWIDWTKIDEEEAARGSTVGRPREKFTSNEEAVNWLYQSTK